MADSQPAVGEPHLPLEDRSLAMFVVCAVMVTLAFVAVVLRTFVRLYVVRAFGWDDVLMLVAMAMFATLCAFFMAGAKTGIGHKLADFGTDLPRLKRALMWWFLSQIMYIWSSGVAKISIAVALLRIIFWILLLADCRPISYFWTQVDPRSKGECLSGSVVLNIAYVYSSLTVICDFTLGIMPALLIWNLHMNKRTKVALAAILSLGAIAGVAVVIRFPFLKYYTDPEFLYSTHQLVIWSVIETGLGIFAGSLVTLRPLFRWFQAGSNFSSRKNRHQQRASGGNYRLSSLTGNASDPRYWRPDFTTDDKPNNVVTTSISSPQARPYSRDISSSQEDLNPTLDSSPSPNQVSVHTSFRISDRDL